MKRQAAHSSAGFEAMLTEVLGIVDLAPSHDWAGEYPKRAHR